MKYLFLGGHDDGKRIEVPEGHRTVVVRSIATGDLSLERTTYDAEIYEKILLRGEIEDFWIFVLKGMSGNEALRRLIEGYRRG